MGAEAAIRATALTLAQHLADAAGAVIRPYFRRPLAVEDKADESPVTIADREAEGAMRRLIGSHFPEHGILGEEYGPERVEAPWVWVLDPIDGTKSFISGMPSFGTLIALVHDGVPVLGVLDQPISRERWVGEAGAPTRLNGAAIRARPCQDLAAASLFATAPEMFRGDEVAAFGRVAAIAKLVRYGADCYAYGLLACGFVDAVVEASLKPYDYCAQVPILEGAGGAITDWSGRPVRLDPRDLSQPSQIAAAGDRRVHEAVIARLNRL